MRRRVGERFRQKGQSLVFGLELAAVSVDVAGSVESALNEQVLAGPIIVESGVGSESEGKGAGETGIARAHRGNGALILDQRQAQSRLCFGGRVHQGHPPVAEQCVAQGGADQGMSLGKRRTVGDRLKIQRVERERSGSAEPIMRTTAQEQGER